MRIASGLSRLNCIPPYIGLSGRKHQGRSRGLAPAFATLLFIAGCGGGDDNGDTGSGGGGDGGGGGDENNPPLPLAQCSTTPQANGFGGFLQATDSDNRASEINQWEADNRTPVTVFLALIIDRCNEYGTFPDNRVDANNLALQNLAANRPNDDIVLVNQHTVLDNSCDDGNCDMALQPNGVDYVHPRQIGYDKMAAAWLEGIVRAGVLPKCN